MRYWRLVQERLGRLVLSETGAGEISAFGDECREGGEIGAFGDRCRRNGAHWCIVSPVFLLWSTHPQRHTILPSISTHSKLTQLPYSTYTV